ncbi:flavodoxin family protein [Liquorilactobacillus mali]|nr:flavodoxin family protein [Liquorilactobacillus mali]
MIVIRYCSKTGNTKKMAELIAEKLGVKAESVATPLSGQVVDILLLGGAVHMMSLDKELKEFVKTLDPQQVKKVIMFGTSGGVMSIEKQLAKVLEKNKLNIAESRLFLHGLAPSIWHITKRQREELAKFVETVRQ